MQDSLPQILIADDHVLFAEALRALLERSYRVLDIVGDGRALLRAAAQLSPDVIVVDIGMPLLNGLDAAKQIHEQLPNVKIVFLTMHDNPNLAAVAMELGSAGFVLKHSAGSELLKAIDEVLHGKSYLTPKLRSDDWVAMKQRARQYTKELSDRQRDVVQMYAEGRPGKEIAYLLNLSQKTIEFHKRHIMEAFNLKTNADLVLFALKQHLIVLDPAPATKKNAL